MTKKNYINAREVLPDKLIKEIQQYVQGKHVYIPKTVRESWGSVSGTRELIEERNEEIVRLFDGGVSIIQLADMFNLSPERIRGIIYERQKDEI